MIWHSYTCKVCKVCNASVKPCKNPVRSMRKAWFLHTYCILIADFNRYIAYFTYFLIKSQINEKAEEVCHEL